MSYGCSTKESLPDPWWGRTARCGAVLRVAAFNKTWLEQKLHGKVTGALQKIDDDTLGTGRVGRVEYVVEGAARPNRSTMRQRHPE